MFNRPAACYWITCCCVYSTTWLLVLVHGQFASRDQANKKQNKHVCTVVSDMDLLWACNLTLISQLWAEWVTTDQVQQNQKD